MLTLRRSLGELIGLAAEGWWVQLPLALRRVSATAALACADGQYLAAWPAIGGIAPLLAGILGLLIGWRTWGLGDALGSAAAAALLAVAIGVAGADLPRIAGRGLVIAGLFIAAAGLLSAWSAWEFRAVFTESRVVMVLAVLLGVASGNLGLMFWSGFVLGDLFLADVRWWSGDGVWFELSRVYLPRLVEYAVLGLLIVVQPLLVKSLVAPLSLPPRHASRQVRMVVAVLLHALVTWGFVYFWSLATPILIRPLFTWVEQNPPAGAIQPLQAEGGLLLVTAVVTSVGRMALQGLVAFRTDLGQRLDRLDEKLLAAPPAAPLIAGLPARVAPVLSAAAGTLFFAGMIQSWWEAALLFAVLALVHAARKGLLRIPLGAWPSIAARVPMLLRILIALAAVRLVSVPLFEREWEGDNTFRPFVIMTVAALVVFYLLSPSPAGSRGGTVPSR